MVSLNDEINVPIQLAKYHVLNLNGRLFAELRDPAVEGQVGYYKKAPHGIRFYDTNRTLFAFATTAPTHKEFWFVNAVDVPEGTWYQHAASSITLKKLGVAGMPDRAIDELIRSLAVKLA